MHASWSATQHVSIRYTVIFVLARRQLLQVSRLRFGALLGSHAPWTAPATIKHANRSIPRGFRRRTLAMTAAESCFGGSKWMQHGRLPVGAASFYISCGIYAAWGEEAGLMVSNWSGTYRMWPFTWQCTFGYLTDCAHHLCCRCLFTAFLCRFASILHMFLLMLIDITVCTAYLQITHIRSSD